jgi:hypothetical protein
MTAKKDLKRRVRDRMERTGERYTEALEHMKAEAAGARPEAGDAAARRPSLIEQAPPAHDLAALATREGFECRAQVPERQWAAIEKTEGDPQAWFRSVFERLRQLLVASIGEPGPDAMRAYLVQNRGFGASTAGALWSFMPFMRKVDSGVRGISPDGTIAAIDVPRAGGRTSLVLLWFFPRGARPPTLMVQVDADTSFVRAEKMVAMWLRFGQLVTRR